MAITTYSELQSSIADWLHRTDLTSVIPDFIALAEKRINRALKIEKAEIDASLLAVVGSKYVALPSDFGVAVALWNDRWQPRTEIRYLTPESMPSNTDLQTTPQYFTVDGSNIAFEAEADYAYPITLRYSKLYALSTGSPTNDMLTKNPDAYLYGSLMESALWAMDDANAQKWKALFDSAIDDIKRDNARNKANSTLSTEFYGVGVSGRSNIFRGF